MFALFAARTTATSPRSLTSARISYTICQMLSRTNLSMWWVLFLSLSACLHTIKTPWLRLHYWALTGYRGFTPQYVNVWVCVWMRKQETEAGNTSRFVRQIQQGKVGLKCFEKETSWSEQLKLFVNHTHHVRCLKRRDSDFKTLRSTWRSVFGMRQNRKVSKR